MVQTICDRCRMVINKQDKLHPPIYEVRRINRGIAENRMGVTSIDLCEDCEQSLRQWMNTFGYNPVEKEGEKQDDEE